METIEIQTDKGLARLDQREAGLITLAKEFSGLKINGIEDKEGYSKVSAARKILKAERVAITKDAKDLREDAVAFQKRVIERQNELIALIEPTEEALEAEEKRIDAEKEAIKAEKQRLEAQKLQDRINALAKFNHAADYLQIRAMTDDGFAQLLTHAEKDYNAEQEKIAAEKLEAERIRLEQEESLKKQREEIAQMKAEQDRINKEQAEREAAFKAEQEKIRKEQAEKVAEIERERQKIIAEKQAIADQKAAEEAEKKRQIELEEARKQAAEAARIEAEQKAERDRIEGERKKEEEKQAAIELELTKSDSEKFKDMIKMLCEVRNKYSFKSKKYKHLHESIFAVLNNIPSA